MMLSNVHAYPCVLHTVPLVRGKRRGSAHHSQRAVRSAIGFSPASRGRSTPLFIWLWWCPDVAGGQHTLTYQTPPRPPLRQCVIPPTGFELVKTAPCEGL